MSSLDVVTGGAGFIGSHLVDRLAREGRRVRVIDDLSTSDGSRLATAGAEVDLVRADLAEAEIEPLVRGADRIFHLAAVPSVPRSVRDPITSHRSIATATLRLLVAAHAVGVGRVVVSSSSSVYGDTDVSPKVETLPARPISPYAVAKLAAERYAAVYGHLHGLRTVNLRYFNVFGPAQDPSSAYAAVIPLFITRALAGLPLHIHGDGKQTRDFTFVENVVDANLAAAAADVPPGSVFNIAAGDPRSLLDLVRSLERILGRRLDVVHGPDRPGDIRHSHADISAARHELAWIPRVDFEHGLERTVAFYRPR